MESHLGTEAHLAALFQPVPVSDLTPFRTANTTGFTA